MATQVKTSSNITLSNSSESSHKICDAVDTEMITPLTSIDNDSTRSLTPEKMDAFHSAREREERIRRNGKTPTPALNQGANVNANGSAWRRQSFFNPAYLDPEGFTPINDVCPGPVYPLQEQIGTAYAYGIRRADGSYTRLLPADELPEINGIPRYQGPEGLIVVPELQHRSPKPECAALLIPNKVIAKLPPLVPPMFGINQEQGGFRRPGDQTQLAIDSIVASAAPSMGVSLANNAMVPMVGPPMRREKIYCDKWVHEGTCAFTQVGCKYKHEMPMDKATQVSLGLNHGVPNWYRRQHGLSVSPQTGPGQIESTSTTPTGGSRTSQSWRRKEASSFSLPTSAQGGTNGRDHRGSFGPIGPPHSRRLTDSSSGDSMNRSQLSVPGNNDGHDQDSKMQGTGRARGYTNGHERTSSRQK